MTILAVRNVEEKRKSPVQATGSQFINAAIAVNSHVKIAEVLPVPNADHLSILKPVKFMLDNP